MEPPKDFEIVVVVVSGSTLYNLNHAGSDLDRLGIMRNHITDIINPDGVQNTEWKDPDSDFKLYSLYKFVHLAKQCNPTILELLFVPDAYVQQTSEIYEELRAMRHCFVTKRAAFTFGGYARAQIKRAKGTAKKGNEVNERINNKGLEILRMVLTAPFMDGENLIRLNFGQRLIDYLRKLPPFIWTPELVDQHKSLEDEFACQEVSAMLPPRRDDFIYWYRQDSNGMPFRPTPFDANPEMFSMRAVRDKAKYDASSVEHIPNLYRIYRNGSGFMSPDGSQVVCRSISIEREYKDFAGVVLVDMETYEKERKAYDSFWEWMACRNEERHTRDWDSDAQVDFKNLMHTMRLLLSARNIAINGEPIIRFEGEERDFLMGIREGRYKYEEVLKRAEDLSKELDGLFAKSKLRENVDSNSINEWFYSKYY